MIKEYACSLRMMRFIALQCKLQLLNAPERVPFSLEAAVKADALLEFFPGTSRIAKKTSLFNENITLSRCFAL